MKFLLLMIGACCCGYLAAQPRADFTPDRQGGCAPVTIHFSNQSTNVSASATWLWNFGNGNSSSLKDPSAIFLAVGSYPVSLTVTDNGQVSTRTINVSVYHQPVVDFSPASPSNCLPAGTTFNSSVTSTDGSITRYRWDFGDGITQETSQPAITHFYSLPLVPTVSLTAISSLGCAATIVKPEVVTIHPAIRASFSVDETRYCNAPANVQFNNTSGGPGVLSYTWDFGDGQTSALRSPQHTYTGNGVYTVRLVITSSVGCSQVITQNGYITVGGFRASFSEPALICDLNNVSLENTSSPQPDRTEWLVDGTRAFTTWNGEDLDLQFFTDGRHHVSMVSYWGACQAASGRDLNVKHSPVSNGFIADIVGACGAPALVNFRDTTAGAVSWAWNFDNIYPLPAQATTVTAQHTFTYDQPYAVSLEVTNAEGCRTRVMQQVLISPPLAGIFIDPATPPDGCIPMSVHFDTRSTEALTTYDWQFGDGSTSTDASPVHLYNTPGLHEVVLNYTTVNGCRGTARYPYIRASGVPDVSFTGPQQVCGNTPAFFIPQGNYVSDFLWDFGDGTGMQWNTYSHQYQQEGTFTVTLIGLNGFCADTLTRTAYVHVSPPFPRINHQVPWMDLTTCDGERGLITIPHETGQSISNTWSWGDGVTTVDNAAPTVSHDYAATGSYQVMLTSVNGACTVKDSVQVYVLKKQHPLLEINSNQLCLNNAASAVRVSNLAFPPFPTYYGYYGYYPFTGTGAPIPGSFSTDGWYALPMNGSISNYPRGDHSLMIITQSQPFRCYDTTNIVNFSVKGPEADMELVNTRNCYRSPFLFRDLSMPEANGTLQTVQWDFGDGVTLQSSPGATVSHQYSSPGYYQVSLRATEAGGCTGTFTQGISVIGPKAAFNVSPGNNVQLNSTVSIINNTNAFDAPSTIYEWMITELGPLTGYSPSFTFTAPGVYHVRLIAYEPGGCRDTMTQVVTVANFNTGFTTSASFIGDYDHCAPVLARFTNTSVNYTRLHWDLGDGTTVDNLPSLSHIYPVPGVFVVKLSVEGSNGLSSVYTDTVHVSRPAASLQIPDAEICLGENIHMLAPIHAGVTEYQWDFGDGMLINGTDSFANHVPVSPGSYLPGLLVSDDNGCGYAIKADAPVIINPRPTVSATPASGVVCKQTAVQLQASGALTYQWSPVQGLSDPGIPNPLALPAAPIDYVVTGTDMNGCSDTSAVSVKIAAPIDISGDTEVDLCRGEKTRLLITGPGNMHWIGNTQGLDDPRSVSPFASPLITTIYTVVATDEYQCYGDTLDVLVRVRDLPAVNAGADLQVVYGSENTLQATASADVTSLQWSPALYLSCSGCATPVTKPYEDMTYVLSAVNHYGCGSRDTVLVKAGCSSVDIRIPTAFTPNHDGTNDELMIGGFGVSRIRSFRIFNRWGETMMIRKDYHPGDANASWNGSYKGIEAPAGIYVYFVELECEGGQLFTRKGTVMLIR